MQLVILMKASEISVFTFILRLWCSYRNCDGYNPQAPLILVTYCSLILSLTELCRMYWTEFTFWLYMNVSICKCCWCCVISLNPFDVVYFVIISTFQNYASTLSVHPEVIDGRLGTLVIESFVVDVPEGNTKDETCYFVEALIKCNLKSLADVSERLAVQDRTEPIDRV